MKLNMKLNVKLLREVKAHILAEPDRLVMGRWIIRDVAPGDFAPLQRLIDGFRRRVPECGTMACLAGWTCILGAPGEQIPLGEVSERACKLLRVFPSDAYKLFWFEDWKERYQKAWRATRSRKKRAVIAAEVIEEFIETHA